MARNNNTHLICSGTAIWVGLAGDSSAPVASGWNIHFQGVFHTRLASWCSCQLGAQVGLLDWSLDSLSHRPLLGLHTAWQLGSGQAVEAAGLVRTWLGNWHRVTCTLFHWLKQSQSPPTFTERAHVFVKECQRTCGHLQTTAVVLCLFFPFCVLYQHLLPLPQQ